MRLFVNYSETLPHRAHTPDPTASPQTASNDLEHPGRQPHTLLVEGRFWMRQHIRRIKLSLFSAVWPALFSPCPESRIKIW
jgi:hypothetical protein